MLKKYLLNNIILFLLVINLLFGGKINNYNHEIKHFAKKYIPFK